MSILDKLTDPDLSALAWAVCQYVETVNRAGLPVEPQAQEIVANFLAAVNKSRMAEPRKEAPK